MGLYVVYYGNSLCTTTITVGLLAYRSYYAYSMRILQQVYMIDSSLYRLALLISVDL